MVAELAGDCHGSAGVVHVAVVPVDFALDLVAQDGETVARPGLNRGLFGRCPRFQRQCSAGCAILVRPYTHTVLNFGRMAKLAEEAGRTGCR